MRFKHALVIAVAGCSQSATALETLERSGLRHVTLIEPDRYTCDAFGKTPADSGRWEYTATDASGAVVSGEICCTSGKCVWRDRSP